MKVGQKVRLTNMPDGVLDDGEFKTRTLLEKGLGKIFPVMGFHRGFVALDLGELNGKPSYLETVYVEPNCVEVISED